MQLAALALSAAVFGVATRFPFFWWGGVLAIFSFAIYLSAPWPVKRPRFKSFIIFLGTLVAFRFILHIALNYWVFAGYQNLVKSSFTQALIAGSIAVALISFVAVIPAAVHIFRRPLETWWQKFLLVFVSLLIWEHVSVIFPVSPFILFPNSTTALNSVAFIGLEHLRILLMLSASALGVLWWSQKRKWALVPVLVFSILVVIFSRFNSNESVASVVPLGKLKDIELIQLRDGHNGGADLKGARAKISWVRSLPVVNAMTWTVWPEGAFDDVDSQSSEFEELISALSQQKHRLHFFGGLRRVGSFSTPTTFVVDENGLVTEQGKMHPFPVGEWSPFPEFFSEKGWVSDKARLIKAATDAEPILIQSEPDFVFITLICSDALSENHVSKLINQARKTGRTPIVIQLFNDVWFEKTQEPLQHSLVTRLWAAHFGVYWLRAGMSGRTEIISPRGEILVEAQGLDRQIVSLKNKGCSLGATGQCLAAETKDSNER